MAYTEVTSQSWFSRIGGAIKGVLVGLLLVVIAFPLLFWNEGRAVHRYKTLKEGAGQVISVPADKVDAANAGKLIHVTGRAETEAILSDPEFGVSVNAIHLKRNVEMYQWKENVSTKEKTKVGGGTETTKTYTYEKVWSDDLIDSGGFKESGHVNPGSMPYVSRTESAQDVRLGAFVLSPSLVGSIHNYVKLELPQDTVIPEHLSEKTRIHDSGFFIGADPAFPQIGDTRVRFEVVYPTEISIVAQQTGNSFEPYSPPKSGGSIELLEIGIVTADAMFQSAQASNRLMAWLLRLVGFLFFFAGFSMIFRPFRVMGDVLPLMGRIIGAGAGLIAFLLAAMLSLAVIAVAWVAYRPMIGIPLLILVVGLIVLIIKKIASSRSKQAVPVQ